MTSDPRFHTKAVLAEDQRTVFILRGPSGAGKSSFWKREHPDAWICDADSYFEIGHIGEYIFDHSKLPEAHNHCMGLFLEGLRLEAPVIVIDNTNTAEWEWINYSRIGKLMGYNVVVMEFVPKTVEDVKMIAARNQHQVPLNVVAAMALNFEHYIAAQVYRIDDVWVNRDI